MDMMTTVIAKNTREKTLAIKRPSRTCSHPVYNVNVANETKELPIDCFEVCVFPSDQVLTPTGGSAIGGAIVATNRQPSKAYTSTIRYEGKCV